MQKILIRIFSLENLYALLLCLILIGIVIMTADKAPQWIYQGF
jgi:cytochrome b561